MDLKLKVLEGKNVGQLIPVHGKKFFVGRAEDCHLRPGSDLISRHHCVLLIEDGYLGVRDFGSKNGTYVNQERVVGERELKAGDRLTIGPLHFEIQIDYGLAAKKRPPVGDIREAAHRTAEDASKETLDIDDWLSEDASDATRHEVAGDTQTVNLSETDSIRLDAAAETASIEEPAEEDPKAKPPAKRPPGKLPPTANATKDSQEAAAAMLNKLRRRR